MARNIDAEDTHTLFSSKFLCHETVQDLYEQIILLQVSKEFVYLLWLHTVLREP
jgi:hypothetical protein